MKRSVALFLLTLVLATVVALVLWMRGCSSAPDTNDSEGERPRTSATIEDIGHENDAKAAPEANRAEELTAVTDETTEQEPSDQEATEQEAEKRVDAFDALTDKWMEPAPKGITMADVDNFVKQFATVPNDRKEECLQRALNLIPDENVMLLAGILMDKTQDKELVELVFNDVLNRSEDVKKPIMQQIIKDKTHPCWADVAWILDVTQQPTTSN